MSKPLLAAIEARLDVLEQAAFGEPRRRLTTRRLADLEGISTRHVMRGVGGRYAQPEVENKRLYWWSDSYRLKSGKTDTPEARAARNPKLRPRHLDTRETQAKQQHGADKETPRRC